MHAVLTEHLPDAPRVVDAISWAVHDGLPGQIKASAGDGVPSEAELVRLSQAFRRSRGFEPAVADTAVRALAGALCFGPAPPAKRRRKPLLLILAGVVAFAVLAATAIVSVVVVRQHSAVATLTALHGTVHLMRHGSAVKLSATGTRLTSGDIVQTDASEALAAVRLASGGVIRLDQNTSVRLTKLPKTGVVAASLVSGRAWLHTTGQEIDLALAKVGTVRLPQMGTLVADCGRAPSCDLINLARPAAVSAHGAQISLAASRLLSLPAGAAPGAPGQLAPDQIVLNPWVSDNVADDRKIGLVAARAAVRDRAHPTVGGTWKVTMTVKTSKNFLTFAGDRFLSTLDIWSQCDPRCEVSANFEDARSKLAYDGAKLSGAVDIPWDDCKKRRRRLKITYTITAGPPDANAEAGSLTGTEHLRGEGAPSSGCPLADRSDSLPPSEAPCPRRTSPTMRSSP